MGPNQLKAAADVRRGELRFPGRFDGHLQDLQEFADAHPTFDLDVATEVNPELWDGTREDGVKALDFWADLYEQLAKSPRYTALYRYQYPTSRRAGTFGDGVDYGASRAWLRLFEGLKPEDIVFKKVDGRSIVVIDRPSILFTSGNKFSKVTEPTILFNDEPLDLSLYLERNVNQVPETEALGVEFIYAEKLEEIAPHGITPQFSQVNLEIRTNFIRLQAGLIEFE